MRWAWNMGVTVGLTLALSAACVPETELDHPCLPESGIYSGCKKVKPGGGCTEDEHCAFTNSVCKDGACVCKPACSGKECGDDGCGGSCGECDSLSVCSAGECAPWPWTDKTSDLTWQVGPTGGPMTWEEAWSHCSSLDLAGGGWRLPHIGELRSLIRGCPATELGSATCKVQPGDCLDSTCNDGALCECCVSGGGPADGCYWPEEIEGTCSWYWSSSPVEHLDVVAWNVSFSSGHVDSSHHVADDGYVRCVR